MYFGRAHICVSMSIMPSRAYCQFLNLNLSPTEKRNGKRRRRRRGIKNKEEVREKKEERDNGGDKKYTNMGRMYIVGGG